MGQDPLHLFPFLFPPFTEINLLTCNLIRNILVVYNYPTRQMFFFFFFKQYLIGT